MRSTRHIHSPRASPGLTLTFHAEVEAKINSSKSYFDLCASAEVEKSEPSSSFFAEKKRTQTKASIESRERKKFNVSLRVAWRSEMSNTVSSSSTHKSQHYEGEKFFSSLESYMSTTRVCDIDDERKVVNFFFEQQLFSSALYLIHIAGRVINGQHTHTGYRDINFTAVELFFRKLFTSTILIPGVCCSRSLTHSFLAHINSFIIKTVLLL